MTLDDDIQKLTECSLCGGGEFRFDDTTHWTGMRSQFICTTLRHWCAEQADPFETISVSLRARTRASAIELWNIAHR